MQQNDKRGFSDQKLLGSRMGRPRIRLAALRLSPARLCPRFLVDAEDGVGRHETVRAVDSPDKKPPPNRFTVGRLQRLDISSLFAIIFTKSDKACEANSRFSAACKREVTSVRLFQKTVFTDNCHTGFHSEVFQIAYISPYSDSIVAACRKRVRKTAQFSQSRSCRTHNGLFKTGEAA